MTKRACFFPSKTIASSPMGWLWQAAVARRVASNSAAGRRRQPGVRRRIASSRCPARDGRVPTRWATLHARARCASARLEERMGDDRERPWTVQAVRSDDGQVMWTRDLGPAACKPHVAADRVYVPTAMAGSSRCPLDDGEPMWERRVGGSPNEILALERTAVCGFDRQLLLLSHDEGRPHRLALAHGRRRRGRARRPMARVSISCRWTTCCAR